MCLITYKHIDYDDVEITSISPSKLDNKVNATVYVHGTFVDTGDNIVIGTVVHLFLVKYKFVLTHLKDFTTSFTEHSELLQLT